MGRLTTGQFTGGVMGSATSPRGKPLLELMLVLADDEPKAYV
jgi:hypothetical protein